MKRQARWTVCVVILVAALATRGQTSQTKESLLIGAGDMLHIHVFDTPELEEDTRVTDAGEIQLMLGGNVKISGLTPALAATKIEQVLKEKNLLLNPRVLVTVTQFATANVSVLGEVAHPGAYPIGTPQSIFNVLAMAGGLSDTAARTIMIERHDGGEKVPYFIPNNPMKVKDLDLKVDPGDTIIVPRAEIIYVLGDVSKPGGYAMATNDAKLSLLQLIARAGGTLPSAVPSHTKLIRKSSSGYIESTLPLNKIEKGDVADIQLKSDDVIFVPFSYLRNLGSTSASIIGGVGGAAIYKF
jgi:polysaccharide export outer membrane protein